MSTKNNAVGDVAKDFKNTGSLFDRLHDLLHTFPFLSPLLVVIFCVIIFGAIVGPRFLHPFNLSLIIQQVTVIGMLGIAQSLVILTAGIDLSVGAIMVFSSVVMGRLGVLVGLPAPIAFAAGLAVGALCGLINGLLVVKVKIPPFIATLGTWNVFFALNLWYSKSESIRSQDIEMVAPLLQFMGTRFSFMGAQLTYGALFMIALFMIGAYVLRWTAFGRHIYAIGNSIEAARLVGIRADRVLISVYTLAGLICGLTGWVLIGRIGSVSPQAGMTANIDSITAVVIGGISLFGGRGAIVGTMLGAFIVGMFRNMLALAGVDVQWQLFAIGVLIVVSVSVDQWIRRVGK